MARRVRSLVVSFVRRLDPDVGAPLRVAQIAGAVIGIAGVASLVGVGEVSGDPLFLLSVAALLAAIGTDQQLSKPFGPKCVTTTKLAFQTKDGKQLGVLGFCDKDESFAKGVFDGSGAEQAAVDVKDPAGFKAALKKIGAIKK